MISSFRLIIPYCLYQDSAKTQIELELDHYLPLPDAKTLGAILAAS